MTGIRSATALSALVGSLVLGLYGCGSAGPTGAAPPVTPVSPRSTVTSPPASVPAKGSAGGEVSRCHTGELSVSDDPDVGGGAAGQHGESLVFENTAGHACSLKGYPGVSFVAGATGTQVGSAFTRIRAETPSITLAPGGRAYAAILLANPDNVPRTDCKPVPVRGYRVYPPDETAAVFVGRPQTACAAAGKAVGQVRPVAAHQSDQ